MALLATGKVDAAQVTWGAAQSNGIGDASGVALANGSNDVMLLGSFNITNAQIIANATDEAFLMSHFIQFGSSTIGDGGPINGGGSSDNGYFLGNSSASSLNLGVTHAEIYYWCFNSSNTANATQYGIFTAPSNPAWIFPADTDVPSSTTTDLADVPHDITGILFGSYGTGLSSDTTSPLFNLKSFAAIPEPSTVASLIFGGAVLGIGVRRRIKR